MNASFDDTLPRPRKISKTRMSRFAMWAWSPIISFQVGLTGGYGALIYFGVAGLIAQPPSFNNTSPDGYAFIWALGLIIGSVLAAAGSISRKKLTYWLELVGASALTLTVGSYATLVSFIAYGLGDEGRIAGSAGFVALSIPIIIRTMWLYSQLLRRD